MVPSASNSGLASAKSAASPPTMIDSTASIAPASPPETGASRVRTPFSRAALPTLMEVCGVIEDMSITRVPAPTFSRTPPSPRMTASTCGSAGTMVMTTSASFTASAMLAAPWPPAATTVSIEAWERSKPVTWWPALTRLTAMGLPMMPRPTKAILREALIASSSLRVRVGGVAFRRPSGAVLRGLPGLPDRLG